MNTWRHRLLSDTVGAKNRAITPDSSPVLFYFFFCEIPKEHMAARLPLAIQTQHGTEERSPLSSLLSFFFLPLHFHFRKCFCGSPNAPPSRRVEGALAPLPRTYVVVNSNPLLHVLGINIIFIHKQRGERLLSRSPSLSLSRTRC